MSNIDRALLDIETKHEPNVASGAADHVDVVHKADEVNVADERPNFFAITFWAFLLGPLIGVAPWVYFTTLQFGGPFFDWVKFVIAFGFAYLFGGLPALLSGAMFAAWLRAGALPGAWRGAFFGALFGAIGGAIGIIASVLVTVLVQMSTHDAGLPTIQIYMGHIVSAETLIVLLFAIVTGAVLGGLMVRRLHRNKLTNKLTNKSGLTKSNVGVQK